jgi:dienelactone hydrolase
MWTASAQLTPSDAAGYRDRARHVAEHGYAAILPQPTRS